MSAGYTIIAEIVKPLTEHIEKGKPLPTLFGALAGGAVGACAGFVSEYLTLPGSIAGALVSAAVAAGRFRRLPRPIGEGEISDSERSPGRLKLECVSSRRLISCVTLLFERAVYISLSDDARQWSAIKESLSQGRDPGISSSRLIWLDTIDSIELPEADAIGLAICYTANGKEQRRSTEFRSRVARKVFLNALEEYNGVYFLSERHEVGLVRATAGPWIVVSIVLLLVTSAAWASAYWTAHPPPPPIGKTEQDWLVRQLVWLGPFKLFMIGAVPFLLSFVWLLKRTLFPPHVHVLTKGSERISGWTIAAQVDSALGESADSAQSSIAFRDATPMAPSGNSYGWKLSALSPLVLMLCGALVPLGEYVDRVRKQAREEQVKREKLQNDLDEQIKSVREGKVKAGEAFRRLFQIDDPTEKRAK